MDKGHWTSTPTRAPHILGGGREESAMVVHTKAKSDSLTWTIYHTCAVYQRREPVVLNFQGNLVLRSEAPPYYLGDSGM